MRPPSIEGPYEAGPQGSLYQIYDLTHFEFSGAFHLTVALKAAPLPKCSPLVERELTAKDPNPLAVWPQMVKEAAYYYVKNWPEMGEQSHFKVIGEKMYQQYPAIGYDGPTQWVRMFL